MMRHLLDSTSEPIAWRKPFVAVSIHCAACKTPLLMIGADIADPDRLWHARLDGRLRGDAVQFALDDSDATRVHKILVWCQTKRCAGNPQVTVASLRRRIDRMVNDGQHAVEDVAV